MHSEFDSSAENQIRATDSSPKIFINYRQSDTRNVVGRIYDVLTSEYGKGSTFLDFYSMVNGDPISEKLFKEVIPNVKAMLVLIGPDWEQTKLDNPQDYVRREIESAFRLRIPILPILIGGAQIPIPEEERSKSVQDLLQLLKDRLGKDVRTDADFHSDMAEICLALKNRGIYPPYDYGPIFRLFKILALGISAVFAVAVLSLYMIMKPPSQIAVGYGLAYPTENAAGGRMTKTWFPCADGCYEGATKYVKLNGALEKEGFAVLNLWKPSALIGIWSGHLTPGSLYFRLGASKSGDVDVLHAELGIKDVEKDELKFRCIVRTDGVARDYVIPKGKIEDAGIDLEELELISIGTSTSAGALPGEFEMFVYGVSTHPILDSKPGSIPTEVEKISGASTLPYPKWNVLGGRIKDDWEPCSGDCFEGTAQYVRLRGAIEDGGFAVLNLRNDRELLGLWSAGLTRDALYFRIAANESGNGKSLSIELSVKDTDGNESKFRCVAPTDGEARNFVIPAQQLAGASVELSKLELVSVGASGLAGTAAGSFDMSLFGISTEPLTDALVCEKIQ